jgi:hypothetical protein
MLTDDELRRALLALDIIDRDGDPDELAHLLRAARDATPSVDPWGNSTASQEISGRRLAARLARLVGESRGRCDRAAAEVFAPQRQRAVFDALVSYADRLTGQTSRRTSSAAAPMPTIRIVSNQEVVT